MANQALEASSSKGPDAEQNLIGETKIKLEPGLMKTGVSKKVVIKMGRTVLAEKDFMSESDEENLVMAFPDSVD